LRNNQFNSLAGISLPQMKIAISETCLYVRSTETAVLFYKKLFGFKVVEQHLHFAAMELSADQMLLFFQPEISALKSTGSHGTSGSCHIAFLISSHDYEKWVRRLISDKIPIEEERNWESGAKSIYFRDPDLHLVELATPGVWKKSVQKDI
jgi:catechol 2,3-dioxygenase-like lactoylglutathione lyase family enzyme